MIILALDLATITGWARGPAGGKPEYGSIGKRGRSHEAILGEFQRWLIGETAGERKPDVIAYELPIMRPTDRANVITILWGLAGIVQATAYQRSIHKPNLVPVDLNDMRKFLLGRAKWKREEGKAAAMRKCRNMGFKPEDDNAAEAIGHWLYVSALLMPATAHRTSPLFSTPVEIAGVKL